MPDRQEGRPTFTEIDRAVGLLVGVSLLGSVLLVGLVHQGFEALSSVRAYVAGEAFWSKAQRDAVYHLMRGALLDEEGRFDQFVEELDVVMGDREGRLELETDDPDLERVRQGFLRGGNHPEDVDRMMTFFRRYRNVSHVDRAIAIWEEGDEAVDELLALGARIQAAHEGGASLEELRPLLLELDTLNAELGELAAAFSAELGEGARWAQRTLFLLVVATAVLLIFVTAGTAWLLARRLSRSRAALKASEARYRDLYERSPFGIFRSSLDGRLLEANPAFKAMLGYGPNESTEGLDLAREVYEDPDQRERIVRERLRDGEVSGARELRWRRRGGEPFLAAVNGRIVRGTEGEAECFEVFVEDVTETRALEEQLREAQKMEALGQLTGGIAHDFNNLLTVILNSAVLLRHELQTLGLGPECQQVDEIHEAAGQGADLVRKLLAFSRSAPLDLRPVELTTLVADAQRLLRRVIPSTIEVKLHLDPKTPPVQADPGAVQQILLNLVTNARDAMPRGGQMEIVVEPWHQWPRSSLGEPPAADEGVGLVALRVKDAGKGMPPEVVGRVFEPFFTTKALGEGTGLGLPMVYGLARQQGGAAEVESTLGEGTEVRLLLQVARDPAPTSGGDEPDRTPDRRLALLLAPDDGAIQQTVARMLDGEGLSLHRTRELSTLRQWVEARREAVALVVLHQPERWGTRGRVAALRREWRAAGIQVPTLILGSHAAEAPGREDGGKSHDDEVVVLHGLWTPTELRRSIRSLLRGRGMGEESPGEGSSPEVNSGQDGDEAGDEL